MKRAANPASHLRPYPPNIIATAVPITHASTASRRLILSVMAVSRWLLGATAKHVLRPSNDCLNEEGKDGVN